MPSSSSVPGRPEKAATTAATASSTFHVLNSGGHGAYVRSPQVPAIGGYGAYPSTGTGVGGRTSTATTSPGKMVSLLLLLSILLLRNPIPLSMSFC